MAGGKGKEGVCGGGGGVGGWGVEGRRDRVILNNRNN